jgi:2-polyprenyl-3-methyl-5-hydroxy-6-metoxy-1,4-benzoquinol methylase
VSAYDNGYEEESRLASGSSRLEFQRTKEILGRVLPLPPARVVDVGAAAFYSFWLADQGYDVDLVDAAACLVDEARRRNNARGGVVAAAAISRYASALDGLVAS